MSPADLTVPGAPSMCSIPSEPTEHLGSSSTSPARRRRAASRSAATSGRMRDSRSLLRQSVSSLTNRAPPTDAISVASQQRSAGESLRRSMELAQRTEHAMSCKQERHFFELRPLTEPARIAVAYWLAESFEWDGVLQAARRLDSDLIQLPRRKGILAAYNQRIRGLLESLAISLVRDAVYLPGPLVRERVKELDLACRHLPCGQRTRVIHWNSFHLQYTIDPRTGLFNGTETGLKYTMTHTALKNGALYSPGLQPLLALCHPNLARVQQIFIQSTRVACLQEHTAEESLAHVVTLYNGNHSEGHVRHIASRVLQVLAYMHSRGLAHGNLRPEYIACVSRRLSGELRLPVPLHLIGAQEKPHTLHSVWGSAPEMLGQSQKPTPQSDLWALGALLYFLLTGGVPFPESSVEKMTEDICNPATSPSWAYRRWKWVSEEAQSLCESLLQYSSEARSKLSAEDLLTNHPWFQLSGAQLGEKSLKIVARGIGKETGTRKFSSTLREGLVDAFALDDPTENTPC